MITMTEPKLTQGMFLVLLILQDGPKHGYEIMKQVERDTQGVLNISAGTLYRSLAELVEVGFIIEQKKLVSEGDDQRRRIYSTTGIGRTVLKHEFSRLEKLIELYRLYAVRT